MGHLFVYFIDLVFSLPDHYTHIPKRYPVDIRKLSFS